jgi:hypothetical protein
MVGGILKIGIRFWSNSVSYGEKLATVLIEGNTPTKFGEQLIFDDLSKIPAVMCRKRVSDRPQKLISSYLRNGKRYATKL